jgi:hypothetical protein
MTVADTADNIHLRGAAASRVDEGGLMSAGEGGCG